MAASKNMFSNPCPSLLAFQLMEWEEIQKAAKSAHIDIDCKKKRKTNKNPKVSLLYLGVVDWWGQMITFDRHYSLQPRPNIARFCNYVKWWEINWSYIFILSAFINSSIWTFLLNYQYSSLCSSRKSLIGWCMKHVKLHSWVFSPKFMHLCWCLSGN